jgi:hypothetical protein
MVEKSVGSQEPGAASAGPGRERGPSVWANWRAQEAGAATLGAYEAALYTDAHVTGEALDGLGPYSLFNVLGSLGPRDAVSVGLGVVLRVEHHLPHVPLDPVDYERTFKDHYVGAAPLSDQVACLLSLALGARFRSGGETRSFDIGAPDVRGRPILATHQAPTMTPPFRGSVLPDVAGRTVLLGEAVTVLAALPRLSADDATQVLRASRLYRQALWIADEDRELSWLLLVSAAEVGATHWAAHNGEPAARLEDAMPALADLLRERGGPDLVVATAGHLAHLIRATVRFLHFVTTFGGEAPPGRPEYKWTQVDWARLKKAVGQVYAYRSAVLHAGEPMPSPLLKVPWQGDLAHASERPLGMGTAHGSTTWAAKDLPMHLHVFAGITRCALIAWWARLADEPQLPSPRTSTPVP